MRNLATYLSTAFVLFKIYMQFLFNWDLTYYTGLLRIGLLTADVTCFMWNVNGPQLGLYMRPSLINYYEV